MNQIQILLTILIIALITMLIRFLPFLIFSEKRKLPEFVLWLGRQLPRAAMMMLVVYCLKDVAFNAPAWGIPAVLGIGATVGLHIWRKQMILSVVGGTVIYMTLIRLLAA